MATARSVGSARFSTRRPRFNEDDMDLNGRGLRLVEEILGNSRDFQVAAHPIEEGGRFVDFGVDARGGCAGVALARVCLADLGRGFARAGRRRRSGLSACSSVHRLSGSGMLDQSIRGLGDQRREIFRDGIRADARRGGERGPVRRNWRSRGTRSRRGRVGSAEEAGRRRRCSLRGRAACRPRP